jgi:hypothetical protein
VYVFSISAAADEIGDCLPLDLVHGGKLRVRLAFPASEKVDDVLDEFHKLPPNGGWIRQKSNLPANFADFRQCIAKFRGNPAHHGQYDRGKTVGKSIDQVL